MPRFLVTPWRDISELIKVRSQFYPRSSDDPSLVDERRRAIDLVRAWKIRGYLPHAVESTALLIDAILNETPNVSPWCIRAAYSTAFARFVTGFVDSGQTSKYKRSMYKIAQEIGLPASFVELRHQAIHEELPSATVLRQAVQRSLVWLWDRYWKKIDEQPTMKLDEGPSETDLVLRESFREVLKPYLKRRIQLARANPGQVEERKTYTPVADYGDDYHDEDDHVIDATCKQCVRICRGDPKILTALVSVLLEPKFLIPANRTLRTPLTPAFHIWDPVLKRLSAHQLPFLSTLIDELLLRLTAHYQPEDITHNPSCEADYLWLTHLATSTSWSVVRQRSGPDPDSVMAMCLMGQNVWSLKLAEALCSQDEGVRRHWADLVDRALLEQSGQGRSTDVAGGIEDDVLSSEGSNANDESRDPGSGSLVREDGYDSYAGWKLWEGPWIPKPIGVI